MIPIILITLGLIGALVIMLHTKQKKPCLSMLANAGTGLLALLAINYCGFVTGLVINFFTVAVTIILGIPGVVGMMVMNIL